jgi:hypothetical protein
MELEAEELVVIENLLVAWLLFKSSSEQLYLFQFKVIQLQLELVEGAPPSPVGSSGSNSIFYN